MPMPPDVGDFDHLVPSSPWPSRAGLARGARNLAVLVAGFGVLVAGLRAVPVSALTRLLDRRSGLSYARGDWPDSPGGIRTLRLRPRSLEYQDFTRIATAYGFDGHLVDDTDEGFAVYGDGILSATRRDGLWVLYLRRPDRAVPVARPAVDVARAALVAAGHPDWDTGREIRPGVFRPEPRTTVPVDTSGGDLLTQLDVAGGAVVRLRLPLVDFEPAGTVEVAEVEDSLGRLRWVRAVVRDVRLVLVLPTTWSPADQPALAPAWALDTRTPEHGVLFAPASG